MKKIFLAAICVLLTLPAFASTFQYTYDGQTLIYETISDSECKVSSNSGVSGDVSIPAKVFFNGNELKVTEIKEFAFAKCRRLTSITISNSVTAVGEWAFAGCTNITSISIPGSVKVIGNCAFYNCYNLTQITSLASVPPYVNVDDYSPYECILYVPKGSEKAYRNAPWWNQFNNILPIENMQSEPNDDVLTVTAGYSGIAVNNAPIGSTVVVKDINNATVANEEIKEANQTINVNRKGIFIVTVDDATYKVSL